MKGFLYRWIINSVALLFTMELIEGIKADTLGAALTASLVLGILNALIRPVLIFLTLPLNIMSLGLFTFVINGFLLWTVSLVVSGIQVNTFLDAFIGAILVSVFSSVLSWLVRG